MRYDLLTINVFCHETRCCIHSCNTNSGNVVSAQAPLDSLKSDFEEEVGESITEFEEYSRQALEEYNEYTRQAAKDYEAYVQSIKTAWGGAFVDDTPTEWVEYGEDLLSRSIVDFDSGNITIEVIIPDDGTSEESLLADAVERLLNSRGSTCPYPSTVDVSEPPLSWTESWIFPDMTSTRPEYIPTTCANPPLKHLLHLR